MGIYKHLSLSLHNKQCRTKPWKMYVLCSPLYILAIAIAHNRCSARFSRFLVRPRHKIVHEAERKITENRERRIKKRNHARRMPPPRTRNAAVNIATASSVTNPSLSPLNKKPGIRPPTPAEALAVLCEWIVDPPPLQQLVGSPQLTNSNVNPSASMRLSLAASLINTGDELGGSISAVSAAGTVAPGAAFLNNTMPPVGATSSQQQQSSVPAGQLSPNDVVSRCQHLTLHYGTDRLYTWGGWLGASTDHPSPDLLCCYDLTTSASQQQQQQQQAMGAATGGNAATGGGASSSAAAAAAGSGAGTSSTSSATSQVPLVSHPGWLPSFVRLSGGTQQQLAGGNAAAAPAAVVDGPHPAVSQFAWAEVAPGVALLFGGWTGTTRTNALTMLSVAEMRWKSIDTAGDRPPPLTFATAVCVSGGKKLVIYGGNGADGPVSDVYMLDLTSLVWRLLPSAGAPAKRSSHTATQIRDNLMVVFGGRSVPDLASLSLLGSSLAGLTSAVSGLPGGAGGAAGGGAGGGGGAAVALSAQEKATQQALQAQQQAQALLYAGTPLLMNDIAVFDVAAAHWQIGLRLEGVAPPARFGHSAVAATPNHVLIFGGTNDQGALMNDAWVLAFDKPGAIIWRPVIYSPLPPPVSGKSAADNNSGVTTTPQSATAAAAAIVAASASSSLVPPPAPRAASVLVRLGRSNCIAVVAGRTKPSSLLAVKPASNTARCSSSVHFLDVTRLTISDDHAMVMSETTGTPAQQSL